MDDYIREALVTGIAVAGGLFVLWTLLRTFTWRSRAGYAVFAGAASAAFSIIVTMLIAGSTA